MSAAESVRAIALRLGLSAEPEAEEDGTFTLPVKVSEDLDEEGGRIVLVSVYGDTVDWGPADGTSVLVARADAGDIDASDDLAAILSEGGATWFARLYAEESGGLIAEAALPLLGTPVECLCQAIQEVADLAGSVEEADED